MPRNSARKSSWELRPGDLPTERMLAEAPCLRGIENNAAFRRILHRARSGPRASSAWLGIRGLLIVLIALAGPLPRWQTSGFCGLLVALLVPTILLAPTLQRFFRRVAPESGFLDVLDHQAAADFLEAGLGFEEIALGIWAARLSQSTPRRALVGLAKGVAMALAVFGACQALPSVGRALGPGWGGWLGGLGEYALPCAAIIIIFCVYRIAVSIHEPFPSFTASATRVHDLHRIAVNPLRGAINASSEPDRILLMFLVAVLVYPGGEIHPLAPAWVIAGIGSLLGVAVAWFLAAGARGRFPAQFADFTREIEFLLERARQDLYESAAGKAPAIGK